MNLTIVLLLALASEPDNATKPPELTINAPAQVEAMETMCFDATSSKDVVDMIWTIYPRGTLIPGDGNRKAYFSGRPGTYRVDVVASGPTGRMVRKTLELKINFITAEEAASFIDPASQPTVRPAINTARRPVTPIEQPKPDPLGIRNEVTALLDKVQSINVDAERLGAAAGFDRVATELLAKHPAGEGEAMVIVNRALDHLDQGTREKWRPFSAGLRELLSQREKDGQMDDYSDYVRACQVVEDVLGEGR